MAGTAFEIDIPVSGTSGALAAAQAVSQLTQQLEAAKASTLAASEAVKSAQAAYNAAEGAADRAAKAVEKINGAVTAQRDKMASAMKAGDEGAFWRASTAAQKLADSQGKASAAAEAAKAALGGEAAALDRLKAAAAGAASNEERLAKTHAKAGEAAKSVAKAQAAASGSGKVNELSEAFGKLGGPLGSLGQKAFGAADGLKKLFSSAGAGAGPYIALAVAIVAITTALIVGTAAMLKFAISSSDASRSSQLLSDGIAKSVAGGRELDAAIYKLGAKVPQTADELRSMAGELAKTGLQGKALSAALEAAAVKAATVKYGPDFAKQTLSLTNQTARFGQNIAGLFGGLKLEGFLGGLAKIIAMFDSTSVTGRAIKVVFESLFQPIVDGIASLAPKVVSLFIQFEIWALKGLIAIKPYGSTILLAGKIMGGVALAVVGAFALIVGIAVGVAVAITAVTAGIIYLGARFIGLVADAVLFAATLISEPGRAIDWLTAKFNEVVAFLQGISLAEIGQAMIDGLIAGIIGGAGGLSGAITGAVGGAIDAAKGLLGISSPSKVFATIGMQTAEGMVGGVEGGAADVQSAVTDMVAPPPAGGAAVSTGKGGGGHNYSGATFNFYGVAGAEDAIDRFLALLEGDAAQLGLSEAPT